MFTRIRRFFYNNRKRILISSAVTLTSLFLLFRHLHSLFLNHQKRINEERFNREQIRRRFEQTQKDALFTIWALVPVLGGAVGAGFNVEAITGALRARRQNGRNGGDEMSVSGISSSSVGGGVEGVAELGKKSKNELWEELKSQSLTKLLTLIYANALLIIFTRLQLNILARREYLEDALKIASDKHGFSGKIEMVDKAGGSSAYVNEQAYLSFSWWLLNRGWSSLKDRVKMAVDEVFEDITPRAELSVDEFAMLLGKTQRLIERVEFEEGATTNSTFITSVLLPPRNLETFVMQQILDEETIEILGNDCTDLRLLLDETNQYVNSSSSLIVLSSLVGAGISTFLEHSGGGNGNDNGDVKLKLAVLLASATKASNEFKVGEQNEYVNRMDCVSELDELSASVYSNFE